MASGDALIQFVVNNAAFPDTLAASIDERGEHLVLDFDAATDEEVHFTGWLPEHYGGGGIDVLFKWAASTATSGNVVHETSFERIQTGTTDLDTASFATAKTSTIPTAATSGVTIDTTIAHSNSEIDGLLKNEQFRLKYRRLGSNGSDTMAGDMELVSIYLTET
jgi:hypothetical protein